jgi:large subunit ribosomal protein L6
MSRIGKQPVAYKQGTKVALQGRVLSVETGKGRLEQWIDPCISVEVDEGEREIRFARNRHTGKERSMHGLYRSLAANMVEGLEQGYERQLEIQGVGYGAKLQGPKLVLNVGFNKPVEMPVPQGLQCECPEATRIIIKGADKQLLGQFAADVRGVRPPEPYKGKGIRYAGEFVRRKVGKSLGA